VTVRDNRANGGGVNYDSMQVTSTTAAGPFVVTRPNTSLSWMGNSVQTVNWNVAGTTGAPVNASNVRISLSTDGGNTFPTVLVASTPNDGTETVTIPDTPTTTARIRVEAVGNIFFDVSNANFTILLDTHSPFLDVDQVVTTPVGADGDAYLEPGESGNLMVTLTNNGNVGATNVTGTLTSSTPDVTVVTSQPVPYPDLAPNASGVSAIPYRITVSSSVPCGAPLSFDVTGSFAEAGGPSVRTFAVSTGGPATFTYSYAGAPVAIPDNNTAGADATMAVNKFSGSLTDLDLSLDGTSCSSAVGSTTVGLTHTWVGDLSVRLTSPLGTSVTVMSRPGGNNNQGNNFCQTVLDDAGSTNIQSITSAGAPFTGTFAPSSALSPFNGQDPNGTWTLNVADMAAQDTGSIRSWSLRLGGTACNAVPPAPGAVPDGTSGTPLTITRSGDHLTLSWGASCNTSGVDYAIYQGTIGSYYSHAMKVCTTQGLLTRTFPTDPGDLYFLVVALSADNEGSYGKDSNGAERPQGGTACRTQLLGGCP
jgi:subtilisin-like proprotein convertase family protein